MEDLGAVIDDTVGGSSVLVPFGPPAGVMISESFVGWVTEQEVTVIYAGGEMVSAARVRVGLIEIDCHKIPARAKGPRWAIGNEEKTVVGAREGAVENVARGWRSRRRRIVTTHGRDEVCVGKVSRGRCGERR